MKIQLCSIFLLISVVCNISSMDLESNKKMINNFRWQTMRLLYIGNKDTNSILYTLPIDLMREIGRYVIDLQKERELIEEKEQELAQELVRNRKRQERLRNLPQAYIDFFEPNYQDRGSLWCKVGICFDSKIKTGNYYIDFVELINQHPAFKKERKKIGACSSLEYFPRQIKFTYLMYEPICKEEVQAMLDKANSFPLVKPDMHVYDGKMFTTGRMIKFKY